MMNHINYSEPLLPQESDRVMDHPEENWEGTWYRAGKDTMVSELQRLHCLGMRCL